MASTPGNGIVFLRQMPISSRVYRCIWGREIMNMTVRAIAGRLTQAGIRWTLHCKIFLDDTTLQRTARHFTAAATVLKEWSRVSINCNLNLATTTGYMGIHFL
ncbi:hypothetical protein D3C81_1247090 [compost metagenome]